ncbi:MAG: hypothetical protein MJA83_05610 [Gammaproteobacteria bacterium]|nr:hypothetical protein [Gammaproteobacteria bacterium]
MSVTPAIDFAAIRGALHDWFSEATGLKTIWADQNRPQPPYPYASLNPITGPVRIGGKDDVVRTTDLAQAGQEVEHCHIGDRLITISCQIHVAPVDDQFGTEQEPDPQCDAMSLMATAEAHLDTEVNRARFFLVSLAFVSVQSLPQIDLPIGGQIIKRTQMDVQFATKSRVVERTTYIENVTITGQLKDEGGASLPDIDFSVTGL